MEIISVAVAAFVALLVVDVLAIAFGRDSRDGFAECDRAGTERGPDWFVAGGSR
jgi:hypothetical protein